MDYFNILNFNREPFSNSPDPEIFFESDQHLGCLHELELAIRMHRGLNTVIGDVGTGKTTLCRQLIRRFHGDEDTLPHLLLDPHFSTEKEFLFYVAALFQIYPEDKTASEWQLKEWIKQYLFRKGVDEGKTVLLIIDEGQKLSSPCLEILREFLNYETNSAKLLQIVIFAQKEFEQILADHANLADRINMNKYLSPLNLRETKEMIRYRLDQASADGQGARLFSRLAIWSIYRKSGGYPRRIINICHKIILAMIIKNKGRAGFRLARGAAGHFIPDRTGARRPAVLYTAIATGVAAALLYFNPGPLTGLMPDTKKKGSHLPTFHGSQADAVEHGLPSGASKDIGTTQSHQTQPPASPPTLLGTIRVGSQDTLSGMITRVYGPSGLNSENLEAVLAANPWIEDPDFIPVGEKVAFPDLDLPTIPEGRWWIQVYLGATLERAYKQYTRRAAFLPPLLLVPEGRDADRDFAIILEESFAEKDQAMGLMADLPGEIQEDVDIVQLP